MSVGHPGESEETVRATRDWLLDVKPDDFDATVITTYPGTPYFDEAVETSRGCGPTPARRAATGCTASKWTTVRSPSTTRVCPVRYISYVSTDHLTAVQLVEQRDNLEAVVRRELGIPYNTGAAAVRYEHSMGQGLIPKSILRSSMPVRT